MEISKEIFEKISAYIKKLTSNHEEIDEVTQEVFIKVHQSIDTLKDNEKLVSWLNRIVYTTLMDYHRKKQKQFVHTMLDREADEETPNEGNESLMECIALLLKYLPDEQRELLEAVELGGKSQTDYARENNLPLSTVKSRVKRGKQKIKSLIYGNCTLVTDPYGNVVEYLKPEKLTK